MEANSVIQEPQKKQEPNEEQEIDENSKSLGNLPEDVLLDILSLLPKKEAVRTSLLSKRWEYLWASMSNLVFDGSLPAKRTICFPNLKILTMKRVTFSDEYSIQQLLSAPPLLEKLELHNCSWGDLKAVTISAPKLQYLSIREYVSIREYERRRSSNGDVCEVMIFGESLKEFYYRSLFGHYCLYNSVSLKKAEIFTYPNQSKQIAHHMYKLLAGLSNVEFLQLSFAVVEVMVIYGKELVPQMPMFNNLMDLEFFGMSIDIHCATLLVLLQKFPCLKTLKFSEGIVAKSDGILNPVPPCFLSQLKCIKIDKYGGYDHELSAVKILLDNAIVLDEIVITCSERFAKDSKLQKEFYKQLRELPKRSHNCKMVLKQPFPDFIL